TLSGSRGPACCAPTLCCPVSSSRSIRISATPDPMSDIRYPISDVRVQRRVQFSENDAAGIGHFSDFFRYFEDAEHVLWRSAVLSIHPEKSAIGWPRVAASCE